MVVSVSPAKMSEECRAYERCRAAGNTPVRLSGLVMAAVCLLASAIVG
ncbi:hypothetical protein HMPREF9622_02372 [Cutibacterium modestum HL037PA3]|uniref:Uncharacterized protein n=1 Tax=Cutibacterium modestum HL044PA1 TaxID=765109 RepID=A0ABP2K995_9ACTN|nr:hypothetical protein HMPREF9607_00273 [Cutibacterium modestum HL044PA1]EFT14612.1 hypothetical protein HMPREF9622_02372 [Cutibacterium modestum HL037PA3]